MNDEKVLKKLKEIIRLGNNLIEELYAISGTTTFRSSDVSHNVKYYKDAMKWYHSARNLLERKFGINSDYILNFINVTKPVFEGGGQFYQENVMMGNGVLESIYDAIKEGLAIDPFYRHELELFSDLLEQAFEFLDKGHRLASAIYGRIVMETTIREYAKKFNIEKSKFDTIITELKKSGVILQTFEHSLRANYKIGSMAAHNDENFVKISDNQVREYLTFIKDRVITLE